MKGFFKSYKMTVFIIFSILVAGFNVESLTGAFLWLLSLTGWSWVLLDEYDDQVINKKVNPFSNRE